MKSLYIGEPQHAGLYFPNIPTKRKFRIIQYQSNIFIFIANTSELLNTYTNGIEFPDKLKRQTDLISKTDMFMIIVDNKVLEFIIEPNTKYCIHRKYKGKYGDIIWINFEHSKMTNEAIKQQLLYLFFE